MTCEITLNKLCIEIVCVGVGSEGSGVAGPRPRTCVTLLNFWLPRRGADTGPALTWPLHLFLSVRAAYYEQWTMLALRTQYIYVPTPFCYYWVAYESGMNYRETLFKMSAPEGFLSHNMKRFYRDIGDKNEIFERNAFFIYWKSWPISSQLYEILLKSARTKLRAIPSILTRTQSCSKYFIVLWRSQRYNLCWYIFLSRRKRIIWH